jgi:hypothetical protein
MLNIIKNEKGMALMTTFMFGLISIGLIAGMYFSMINSTRSTGVNKRYIKELETAKAISEYVMATLYNDKNLLTCLGANTTCETGDYVRIPFNIPDHNTTAFMIYQEGGLYSLRSTSANATSGARAEINFVYLLD